MALAKQRLLDDNVPDDRLSMVWSPRSARQFSLLSDSQGRWLGPPPGLMDDEVRKYPTTAMPNTRDPGAAGSAIVIGDFRDFIVNVNLQGSEILRKRFSQSFELGWLAYLRMGVSATRPSALEVIERLTT